MSDNFLKIYNGASYTPADSDPSNPVAGDVFYASSTHATKDEGFHVYEAGAWVKLAGTSNTQDLQNKTLDNTNTASLRDDQFHIEDSVDSSAKIQFYAGDIATSTTRTITMDDADVDLGNINTNNLKGNDLVTLSGRPSFSTDNGTFTGATISDNVDTKVALQELETALEGGANEFADDVFRVKGSVDATKKIALEADGITTATTRTITMPDSDVDLADIGTNTTLASGKQDPISGTANEIDVAADVVGLSDNPIIPGTDALVLPKGTTAEGTNTTDGAFRFNTTENRFEGYKDGAFAEIGGGGAGGLDLVYTEDFETNAPADIYSINGSPTTDAIVLNNTTTEMSGTQSAKVSIVTNNQGSLITLDNITDHDATSGAILIQPNTSDTLLGLFSKYLYDGSYGDIDLVVEESSDNTTFTENARLTLKVATAARLAQLNFKLDSASTHYRFYFDIVVENNGKTLEWDNIYVSDNPSQTKSEIQTGTVTYTGLIQQTSQLNYYRNKIENTDESMVIGETVSSVTRFTIKTKSKFVCTANSYTNTAGDENTGIRHYNSAGTLLKTANQRAPYGRASVAMSGIAEVGDYFLVVDDGAASLDTTSTIFSITATVLSNNVVFEGKSLLPDIVTNYLSSNVTANGDIADLTFTGLIIGDTYTIAGHIWLDSYSGTDTGVYFRGGSGGSGTIHSRVVIKNGNALSTANMHGVSFHFIADSTTLYTNKFGATTAINGGGNTSATFLQLTRQTAPSVLSVPVTNEVENNFSANISAAGVVTNENSKFIDNVANPSTSTHTITWESGFFTLPPNIVITPSALTDATYSVSSNSATSATIRMATGSSGNLDRDIDYYIHVQRQGTDYKAPKGYFLGNMAPIQVAYVKDLKTSGTAGGTSTSNTVHDRDLNDLSGDTDFISLSSNAFTLHPGKYIIEIKAPGYKTNQNQIFLHDGTNYILDGASKYYNSTNSTMGTSDCDGQITITSNTTYKVKHWISTGLASQGLGAVADNHASNPQSNEVYTTVKITKLR